jgi:2'-5' RNA ligase
MPEKIAIDVVLLLPENINNICKELNKGSDKKDYISFEDGYNPHLTLGMGSPLVNDIGSFKKELNIMLKKFKVPEIQITGLGSGKYDYFSFEVTESLQGLHNNVFDLISKHSAGPVTTENFYEMTEPGSLINWVNNFKINSAYGNYHPHITLGIGIADMPLEFPISFKPVSVGFFHLGKHGTCKKLLSEFRFI